MIQYAIKCDNDHRFDSWFQSADAFDKLKAANLINCSICGSSDVEKAIMAPRVQSGKEKETDEAPPVAAPLSEPANPAEQALAEIKRKIEDTSEYVGSEFATEARAMHDGDAPERAIYGEAKVEDAKKLIDDGVPVVPLPFTPGRKTN
ncbi:MAG: DUF1178 family protein [Thalassovita sp.]